MKEKIAKRIEERMEMGVHAPSEVPAKQRKVRAGTSAQLTMGKSQV